MFILIRINYEVGPIAQSVEQRPFNPASIFPEQ